MQHCLFDQQDTASIVYTQQIYLFVFHAQNGWERGGGGDCSRDGLTFLRAGPKKETERFSSLLPYTAAAAAAVAPKGTCLPTHPTHTETPTLPNHHTTDCSPSPPALPALRGALVRMYNKYDASLALFCFRQPSPAHIAAAAAG